MGIVLRRTERTLFDLERGEGGASLSGGKEVEADAEADAGGGVVFRNFSRRPMVRPVK